MSAASIPVTIIAGFLGCGKTSLLNHLLANAKGRRLAALVNDFGALNIDSELIAAQNGNQISLANGCVCCSIGDDLTKALAEVMMQSPRPDHIVIEASGVADPARIAAFTQVDRDLRLDGIVTLVDATAHHLHADDPHLADNYHRQVTAAHFLLISKTDLVAEGTVQSLEATLQQAKPETPIAAIAHGQFDSDIILGLGVDAPHETPLSDAIRHDFRHWAGHMPAHVPRADVIAALATLAPNLLRAKGVLADDDGAYMLHYAGGQVTTSAFDGVPSGHFVLIGKPDLPNNEDLDALLKKQKECA